MSVSSVPSIIAALSMKPVPPMLVRSIASTCAAIAADSQRAEPRAPVPTPTTGTGLDQRA